MFDNNNNIIIVVVRGTYQMVKETKLLILMCNREGQRKSATKMGEFVSI
jgi:hypothetical protein